MSTMDIPIREFMRNSASAVFLLDETASIIHTNRTAETLLWRPLSGLVGLPFADLLARDGASEINKHILAALESHEACALLEVELDAGDGNGLTVSLNLTPLRNGDGQTLLLMVADDITLKKDIEQRILDSRNKFRAAIDAATDWILFIDQHYQILAANTAFAMHVGQSVKEIWGKRCRDIVRAAACETCLVPIAFSTGRSFQREVVVHSEALSADRLLSVTVSPYLDMDGRVTAVVEVMRDITEETRWQAEHHELERLHKLKDDFLASVSHELRTPLTAIKTMVELLIAHPDEDVETRKELLGIVEQETDRLTRLINDVLDLSRLRAGKAKWSYREFDLTEVVRRVMTLFRSEANAKEIALVDQLTEQPETSSELPFSLTADKDKVEQVIANLVSNAVKFTPRGGTIVVAAEHVVSDPPKIKIRVADTGIGIDEKDVEAVFEEFTQVGTSTTGKPSGTGLGLPICRRIVEHHGGTVWAESEKGKGSTFFVELPVVAPDYLE